MSSKPFRSLPLGSTFRFTSETVLGYQGARGPWIKLTPRKYMHEDGGPEVVVGSVRAEVVEVAANVSAVGVYGTVNDSEIGPIHAR